MFTNNFNFIQTGSNTVLIADLSGLMVANDNLLSGRIDTLSGFIIADSGRIDSLSGQFVSFQASLVATTGYIQGVSGYLYGQITGSSGVLNNKIVMMSGYFTGVSGNLQAQINALNVATGVLQTEFVSLSGLLTGVSGSLQLQINALTGGGSSGIPDASGGILYFQGTANPSINWYSGWAYNDVEPTILFKDRVLLNPAADLAMDWGSRILYGVWSTATPDGTNPDNVVTVGYVSGFSGWIIDNISGGTGGSVANVDGDNFELLYPVPSGVSINWLSGIAYDPNGQIAFGWGPTQSRCLLGYGSELKLDWGNGVLYEGWTIGTPDGTNPISVVNVDFVTGAIATGAHDYIWKSNGTGFNNNNNNTDRISLFTGLGGQVVGLPNASTLTLDPSFWTVGKQVTIQCIGRFYTDSPSSNYEFYLMLNGSGIGGIEANDLPPGVGEFAEGNFLKFTANITCMDTGVAGSLFTEGEMRWKSGPNNSEAWTFWQTSPYYTDSLNPTALDLSVPATLDFNLKMTTNPSVDNGFKIFSAIVKVN